MVPPNLYAVWEQQTAEALRANDRARQQARERSIAARVWLERALRALETSSPTEADP